MTQLAVKTPNASRAQRRRDTAVIKRAARRYNSSGCARCGGNGATSVADVLADGTAICHACRTPADAPRIIGGIVGFATQSDGQAEDRAWFAQNPGKAWRLRPVLHMEREELIARDRYTALVLSGEHGRGCGFDERTATSVLTVQIEPGQRMRLLCTPPDDPAAVGTWLDDVALPVARARVSGASTELRRLAPEHHARATNALALSTVQGDRFFEAARETGQAMVEARRATRQ